MMKGNYSAECFAEQKTESEQAQGKLVYAAKRVVAPD